MTSSQELLAKQVAHAISNTVPAYSRSSNPSLESALLEYCEHLCDAVCNAEKTALPKSVVFGQQFAISMAKSRFPLEAILQSNRAALSTLTSWFETSAKEISEHDQASRMATISEIISVLTDTVATAYVNQVRLLAEAAVDERAGLLKLLLDGYDESDARVAGLLRRAGYSAQRQSYCVVIAVPFEASEMEFPARGRRLVKAIVDLASTVSTRTLADVVDNRCVCIVSQTRRASGWTKATSDLATKLYPVLKRAGNSVMIGISTDVPATAAIPDAFRQALHATQCTSLDRRVVQFAELSLMDLLVQQGGEAVHQALPGWAAKLFRLDDKAKGKFSATLRSYAGNNMNVQRAAKQLEAHPNTVYQRLERIAGITGLDPREFEHLQEMLIALRLRAH